MLRKECGALKKVDNNYLNDSIFFLDIKERN